MADPKPVDPEKLFANKFGDIATQLRDLQKLTGTQKYQAVQRLEDGLANLQANLPNLVADLTYTKSQINSQMAGKSNTGHTHPASDITGGTLTGDLTVTGGLQGNAVRATTAPGTNITGTRVAAWLQSSDGLLGTASSSERFKTNIRTARVDPGWLQKINVVYYQYIAELEQRELDPTYRVATEIGVIAERLHEAGLWQFVIYERESDGSVKVDDAGNPVCFGVRYELLALALIPAAQLQAQQIKTAQADIASFKSQLESINSKLATLGVK